MSEEALKGNHVAKANLDRRGITFDNVGESAKVINLESINFEKEYVNQVRKRILTKQPKSGIISELKQAEYPLSPQHNRVTEGFMTKRTEPCVCFLVDSLQTIHFLHYMEVQDH